MKLVRSRCIFLILFLAGSYSSYSKPGPLVTWENAVKNKKAEITVYWYESRPFIYRDDRDKLVGIEYEIMEGFKRYLTKQGITISVKWVEAKGFADCYNQVAVNKSEGSFAVSAFSVMPERQKEVSFSPMYFSNASVLISSKNIPIVKSVEEFRLLFSKLTAITIRGTTYEKDLLQLREQLGVPFVVEYIPSAKNVLKTIEKRENCFGYIDLPIYLMLFNENPSVGIKRQNILPMKREGYGVAFPLGGSWRTPIDNYFNSEDFKNDFENAIPKYLKPEVYKIVEEIIEHSDNPVDLLSREKEIQSRLLEEKSKEIQDEARTKNILIALSSISTLMLVSIVILYRKRNKQKDQIEIQRQNIEQKNLQLEKRNEHLLAIDEEKNNLIKILAHDLRTPINQVQGLAHLLELDKGELTAGQNEITHKITEATERLNKMITNILDIDSLENSRVKIFTEPVRVYALLSHVVKSFEKAAQKKNIDLQFKSENSDLVIKGDPLFLTQVFENLISNAIKFSPPGKKVNVYCEELKNKIRIIVEDFGPGLTPEDMQQAFKKFAKLSARPTGGENSTGLGLSIVKKYVEMMSGFVWSESEPNKVTRFITEFDKFNA